MDETNRYTRLKFCAMVSFHWPLHSVLPFFSWNTFSEIMSLFLSFVAHVLLHSSLCWTETREDLCMSVIQAGNKHRMHNLKQRCRRNRRGSYSWRSGAFNCSMKEFILSRQPEVVRIRLYFISTVRWLYSTSCALNLMHTLPYKLEFFFYSELNVTTSEQNKTKQMWTLTCIIVCHFQV